MVQSLERAFTLLESFREQESQGISQLVEATGLPKATVHRLARTLTNLGYLEQDPKTAQYRLGLKWITLARISFDRLSWRPHALAAMDTLQKATGESVYLGVRDGTRVLFIDERMSSKPVRVTSSIGLRAPLHATAAGKAILAHLSAPEREQAIRQLDLESYTDRTLSDLDLLAKELAGVRERGYAVNDREWVEDACYIASAIVDPSGQPVGAISVGAPATRLNPRQWDDVGKLVKQAADRVSAFLGYRH